MYMNLLTGKYNVPHRINQWFSDFLDSFVDSEYYAQDTYLKPWQYAGLMRSARTDNWNMLSSKQWGIFRKYLRFEHSTYGEFANFEHHGRIFRISISDDTGFVSIKIN